MPEKLAHIIGSFPFMLLISDETGKQMLKVDKTRIVETIISSCIIGVIVSALLSWRDLSKLQANVEEIKILNIQFQKNLEDYQKEVNEKLWELSKEVHKNSILLKKKNFVKLAEGRI